MIETNDCSKTWANPTKAMGCRKCSPISVVKLKGKNCQCPIPVKGEALLTAERIWFKCDLYL